MCNDIKRLAEDFEKFYKARHYARQVFNEFINEIGSECCSSQNLKKVYEIIDHEVFGENKDRFITQIEAETLCYRARIIPVEDYTKTEKGIGIKLDGTIQGYNEENSREPLVGISSSGRNNISGVSYLYMASDPETACTEVKPQLRDLISLATFKIESPMRIVDFSTEKRLPGTQFEGEEISLAVFFTELMLQFSKPVKNNQYYPTQIIADYIRKTGIDGIKYKSFLTPNGYNYTIFNSHPSHISFLGSRVLVYQQANYSYWDLEAKKAILTNREGKMMEYDADIGEKMRNNLKLNLQSLGE